MCQEWLVTSLDSHKTLLVYSPFWARCKWVEGPYKDNEAKRKSVTPSENSRHLLHKMTLITTGLTTATRSTNDHRVGGCRGFSYIPNNGYGCFINIWIIPSGCLGFEAFMYGVPLSLFCRAFYFWYLFSLSRKGAITNLAFSSRNATRGLFLAKHDDDRLGVRSCHDTQIISRDKLT